MSGIDAIGVEEPEEVVETVAVINTGAYSPLQPADLGAIITNAKARKIVWAIYGLAGIGIVGLMGGLTAIGAVAPDWFLFVTGTYTAVGPAFASLAIANIDTEK